MLTLSLMANQVAAGLALSLFGVGLSAFVGLEYVSVVIEGIRPLSIAGWSDIPVVGRLLFGHNPEFSELASRLAGQAVEMATCAVARFGFDERHWAGIGRRVAERFTLDKPER